MQRDKMDVTDLLADESFVSYCKNSSPADVAFWENYLEHNPSRRELIELAKARFLLLFNVLADADREEQATRLKNRMNQKEVTPVVKIDEWTESQPRRSFSLPLKFAGVAVVLLIGLFFTMRYYSAGNNKDVRIFATAYGERKNIQLPDGSMVKLNAGSKIEIGAGFGDAVRNVYLEGEAFFDVAHNDKAPFIVHTSTMDIKALGTAFDVKAYGNEKITETSLIRGLVEVTLKENDNRVLLLRPNHKISWQHHTSQVDTMPAVAPAIKNTTTGEGMPEKIRLTDDGEIKEIAWKEDRLIFEDDSFEEIAILLERWYGVRIEFESDAIRNYRFTATFEKEDLQKVLEFLKETKHFNFHVDTGETTVVSLSE